MESDFFKRPILNSPYEYSLRHWELDAQGQPTQRIIETRRRAEFITPIPKPRKPKGKASQAEMVFKEGKDLSTEKCSMIRPQPSLMRSAITSISGAVFRTTTLENRRLALSKQLGCRP